ncbi:MAG: hypothetical protein HY703_08665 [Gemmatimonadetes bacterium]|nr:hypothetical protein [Gemmatimonadota bacterium]
MVFESEFASLGDYERALQSVLADPDWQGWYPKFRKLIRGGRRDLYRIVE